jgi:pre-mRNA-processing factor SLU7
MSHKVADCLERPRAKGAKWTGKHIAADDKIQELQLAGWDSKRDRYNGYDTAEYSKVVER